MIGLPPKDRENGEGRSGKILLFPVDDLKKRRLDIYLVIFGLQAEGRIGYLENLIGSQNSELINVRATLDEMGRSELVELHGGDKFLLAFLRAEMSKCTLEKTIYSLSL